MGNEAIWLAIAAGCIWHGAQIIWVAPRPPSQLRKDKPVVEKGSADAFNLFWMDQYAWLGISLCLLGACIGLWGVLL